MPELPEVETIRQDLRKKILNTKIIRVQIYHSTSVARRDKDFVKALTGNQIKEIDRRGKLMIWRLRNPSPVRGGTVGGVLLVHLKMTGQLIYEKETRKKIEILAGGHKLSERDIERLPNQWTRIVFVFADGSQLFFNDLRLFGYIKLASREEVERVLNKYGPEPIQTSPPVLPFANGRKNRDPLLGKGEGRERSRQLFTLAYFSALFPKRKNTNLKALLLNQELIAGLGNIYVDEVCFGAGVRPSRRVGSITKLEQQKLFSCIPKILSEAIKHRGTTFRNFLDSSGKKGNYTDFLKVYDRDGKPCKRCGSVIKKIVAAGRGTHYCPKCQR